MSARKLAEWGWGLLTVEQRGQTIGHHLAGYIYGVDATDVSTTHGRLLSIACAYLDRELVRLHGAADPDRVWTWHPEVVNLESL